MMCAAGSKRVRPPYPARDQHEVCQQPGQRRSVADDFGRGRTVPGQGMYVISPESTILPLMDLQSSAAHLYTTILILSPRRIAGTSLMDLLITNLLYPMTRALYGVKIREPYAPEFAFSGRLGSQFLGQNALERWNWLGPESELHFTLAAIAGGSRICQSFLGNQGACRTACRRFGSRCCEKLWAFCSPHWSPNFPRVECGSGSQPIPTTGGEAGDSPGSVASQSETVAGYVLDRSSRIGIGLSVDSFSCDAGRAAANRRTGRRGAFVTLRNCGSRRFTSLPRLIRSLSSIEIILSRHSPRFFAEEHLRSWSRTATVPPMTSRTISKACALNSSD